MINLDKSRIIEIIFDKKHKKSMKMVAGLIN